MKPRYCLTTLKLHLLFAIFACAFMATSCSGVNRGVQAEEEAAPQPYELTLSLDKETYQPGEMVTCKLRLRNLTGKTVQIANPQTRKMKNESNLNFYVSTEREDTVMVARRTPIQIPGRGTPDIVTLQPGESYERAYGFVNLTEGRGDFRLQANFTVSTVGQKGSASDFVVSPYVDFTVKGERRWHRNRSGLLAKADAIKVAKEKYGGEVKDSTAYLRENQWGLYDWWVTLEKMPYDVGPGEDKYVAYYVSPYGCTVFENRKPKPLPAPADKGDEVIMKGSQFESQGEDRETE